MDIHPTSRHAGLGGQADGHGFQPQKGADGTNRKNVLEQEGTEETEIGPGLRYGGQAEHKETLLHEFHELTRISEGGLSTVAISAIAVVEVPRPPISTAKSLSDFFR
jgi:hypothetical protein